MKRKNASLLGNVLMGLGLVVKIMQFADQSVCADWSISYL